MARGSVAADRDLPWIGGPAGAKWICAGIDRRRTGRLSPLARTLSEVVLGPFALFGALLLAMVPWLARGRASACSGRPVQVP
jgi:hypothetical protein